jgi:TonB family protein
VKFSRQPLLSCFLLALPLVVHAAPFSEKVAFCKDQVRDRFFSEYEMQKAYNNCMANADRLIQAYEQEKFRIKEQFQANQDRMQKEFLQRKQIEDAKQEANTRAKITALGFLCPEPVYPSLSRRREEEGVVILKIKIDAKENKIVGEVIKSSGFAMLDNSAISTLDKCQFDSKVFNEKSQNGWIKINWKFKLE